MRAIRPMYKIPQIGFKFTRYVQVKSAFSGFGIYRYSSIIDKSARYDSKHIKEIEHIYFNSHFNKLIVDTRFNPLYKLSKKGKKEFNKDFSFSIYILLIIIIIISLLTYGVHK